MEPHEAYRKLVHMAGALGPPAAILLFGWSGGVAILLFIAAHVVVGALLERRGVFLPIIGGLILRTRRPDELFPIAPLEFLVSIFLIGIVFHEDLFFPAVAVLALGDGTAALVGLAFGRRRLPGNPRKSWAGLAAGVVAGTLAAALFAATGIAFHAERFEVVPILPGPILLNTILFLVAGYALVFGALEVLARAGHAPRVANARAVHVAGAFVLALIVAVGFLIAAADRVTMPLLSDDFGYANSGATLPYAALAGALTMVLEGWLRRHDNLVVPFAFVGLNLALLRMDPLGLV